MTRLKLTKPIQAHGEPVSELTFKELTGGMIRRCGTPYDIEIGTGAGTKLIFNTDHAAKLISALAGIPVSSVDSMSGSDFNAAMMLLVSFLDDTGPKISSELIS